MPNVLDSLRLPFFSKNFAIFHLFTFSRWYGNHIACKRNNKSGEKMCHLNKLKPLNISDTMQWATDAGLVSALVLLDLSSDTVDHEIVIDVLGFRFDVEQEELEYFRSYHTGRYQRFKTPDSRSGPVSLTCTVPQGFRISPYESAVYTEDVADTNEQLQHRPSLQRRRLHAAHKHESSTEALPRAPWRLVFF